MFHHKNLLCLPDFRIFISLIMRCVAEFEIFYSGFVNNKVYDNNDYGGQGQKNEI